MSTATTHDGENEVTILARFLGNGDGQLPQRSRPLHPDLGSATATRPACTTWPCGTRRTP